MIFQWIILFVTVFAIPMQPPFHIEMSSLKRKASVSALSYLITKTEHKPGFITISPQLAALFGKSHERFTLPSRHELQVVKERLDNRLFSLNERLDTEIQLAIRYNHDLQAYSNFVTRINYNFAIKNVKKLSKEYKEQQAIADEIAFITSRAWHKSY
jgi:hypothetical protein